MTNDRLSIDLFDPYFYVGDIHPALHWMRENEPVYYDDRNGIWGISRMAELRDIERRDDLFSSKGSYRVLLNPDEKTMIGQDDPAHQDQRKLISNRFTPRAVALEADSVRRTVVSLIDGFLARGALEVVEELAAQLPARLTASLIGFDEDQWREVKNWSERLMRIDMMERRPDLMLDGFAAVDEFAAELRPRLAEKKGCPAADLMSIWANSDLGGAPMSFETILDETGLMISGGAETTRTTIARGLIAFCEHPDQWERMAEDPSIIPTAVEEVFRWITPLNQMLRTATADTEVGGRKIGAGDRLMLLYPSANRDSACFEDPYRFDVGRDPNPHIAFGLGTHFCLGANFARLTLRTLLEELVGRIRNLRITQEPVYEPNIFVKAVVSVGIGFDLR